MRRRPRAHLPGRSGLRGRVIGTRRHHGRRRKSLRRRRLVLFQLLFLRRRVRAAALRDRHARRRHGRRHALSAGPPDPVTPHPPLERRRTVMTVRMFSRDRATADGLPGQLAAALGATGFSFEPPGPFPVFVRVCV